MGNQLKVACATKDGIEFVDTHFGDADYYDVYLITEKEIKKVAKINNTTEEEVGDGIHGDPKKAKSISEILQNEKVNVTASYKMGPNIKRMKRKFVPIILRNKLIEDGLILIQKEFNRVMEELEKGEEREHIILNKK